jgi:type I restriction enzyme S subunit
VSDWTTLSLREAVELNPAERLPKNTVAPYVDMAALSGSQRLHDTPVPRTVSSGSRFRDGDTLLARITPCLENGKTAQVSGLGQGQVGWGSTEFIVLRERTGISDNRFVYYLARSPEFREFAIRQMIGSSGRQRVQLDALAEYQISLPSLAEQRAIAGVLGALDDKIESNRRVVDLVSRLSRAECQVLIRDSPGSLRRLGDVATFRYGKALAENDRQNGHVPVYGSAGVTGYHDSACVKGPSIIVGRKGRPGTVYLSFDDCWPIDTTFWLEVLPGVRLTWLYFAVEEMNLGRFGADSAVPGLNREMAERDELFVPDEETQGKIEGIVWPILERRRRAETESGRLIALRDALLPELLTGRLQVREVEKVVEEVV